MKHKSVPRKPANLLQAALALSPNERFALADGILSSLDAPDPEIDRIWIDEAARRLAAFRRGEVKGIPAEDVIGPV
jgi:putative addiction module component (TIGR02574 family)